LPPKFAVDSDRILCSIDAGKGELSFDERFWRLKDIVPGCLLSDTRF